MPAVLTILGLLLYLVFMVDWREFRGVMKEGGWATIVYYCVIGIFIFAVMTAPHAASTPAMHH